MVHCFFLRFEYIVFLACLNVDVRVILATQLTACARESEVNTLFPDGRKFCERPSGFLVKQIIRYEV